MRRTLALILAQAILCLAYGQKKSKEIPEFGQIDKTELERKTCDYDPDAPAEIIFETGLNSSQIRSAAYGSSVFTDFKKHVRIKILKEKGLEEADIKFIYATGGNNRISNLVAQTYNLDASGNIVITKVEKQLIYEKRVDKKYTEVAFAFPDVKPGSVIEYKYMISSAGIGIRPWHFQHGIPTRYSRCEVEVPNSLEFVADQNTTLPVQSTEEGFSQTNSKTYIMRNIPALPDEPYMSSEEDYLQRIEFRFSAFNRSAGGRVSLLDSWPKLIRLMMEDEDFGLQLKRNIPRTKDLDDQLKGVTDQKLKMCRIYDYVRKNMEWDGTVSKWALDGVKSAWEKKKGTSGEINLILINLLKDADIDVKPLLVATRGNATVNPLIPDVDQFNSVVAYVKIEDKYFTLDATEKYLAIGMIPPSLMYSQGLVINKVVDVPEEQIYTLADQGYNWVTLWDEKQVYGKIIALQSSLQANGTIAGEALVNNLGFARIEHMKEWKKNEDDFKQVHFVKPYSGISIDNYEIANADKDSLAFQQKFKFTIPANSSGDYQYFSLNLFAGLEKNPFLADNRYTDILFGNNQQYTIYGTFTIPDGYAFEELPKNMRMIMPDTSITLSRFMEVEGNKLGMRISLDFKRPYFTVDEYPLFKEFYKKLFAILNEQVVVRKKS